MKPANELRSKPEICISKHLKDQLVKTKNPKVAMDLRESKLRILIAKLEKLNFSEGNHCNILPILLSILIMCFCMICLISFLIFF